MTLIHGQRERWKADEAAGAAVPGLKCVSSVLFPGKNLMKHGCPDLKRSHIGTSFAKQVRWCCSISPATGDSLLCVLLTYITTPDYFYTYLIVYVSPHHHFYFERRIVAVIHIPL